MLKMDSQQTTYEERLTEFTDEASGAKYRAVIVLTYGFDMMPIDSTVYQAAEKFNPVTEQWEETDEIQDDEILQAFKN